MSNAKTYQGDTAPIVAHSPDERGCYTLCGRDADALATVSEVRSDVTCKRCLASLAKRDRTFQRKARRHYTVATWLAVRSTGHGPWVAARAIAAEEGRS